MSESGQLVSAVIPTFNREAMILDALASVARQSYRPIQIVVIDDGSSDKTGDVVGKWIEDNIEDGLSAIYVRQENSGGNVARNHGICCAEGELIAFLDSDDLWHPTKIEKQVEVLKTGDEIGAVYCGLQQVEFETGKTTSIPNRPYPQGDLLATMLVSDVTAPTSTYMVRKSVFDEVGCFDEELQARQDWDMWIRVSASFHIGCVPEVLVDFRDHAGPRTFSDPTREIRAYKRILEKYKELHNRFSFFHKRKIHAAFYKRKGRVAFHYQKSRSAALFAYMRSLINWPFDFDCYAALLGLLMPRNSRKFLNQSWNALFGKTRFAIKSH